MKQPDEGRAYNKRRRHATPPAPVCPPLCLTVFGHHSESISTLTKSKEQMTCPIPTSAGPSVIGRIRAGESEGADARGTRRMPLSLRIERFFAIGFARGTPAVLFAAGIRRLDLIAIDRAPIRFGFITRAFVDR
jgi:hypothetical protein